MGKGRMQSNVLKHVFIAALQSGKGEKEISVLTLWIYLGPDNQKWNTY
jgi:hypothetical protein